jgi:raffinose/stachyose/melibiose transport system substrate-binding protein
MRNPRKFLKLVTVLGASAALMATSACQAGSLSGNNVSAGVVQIKFFSGNTAPDSDIAKALADGFNATQTKYQVTTESHPGGTEGDNLVKTRLATGSMDDLFQYNSGSLMNNLNPSKNLIPLDDQSYVKDYSDTFKLAVTSPTDSKIYGAPYGAGQGGGIMYNIKVYKDLGLSIPKTWAEFIANCDKIKAAGKTAVIQSYGTTWTSQLFVLADFANVNAADPSWAANYTANKAKYADAPAIEGFQHVEDTYKAGYFNSDAASLTVDNALKMLATGAGVQYPILSSNMMTVQQNNPDLVKDLGFFPIPGNDASKVVMTDWVNNGIYVPTTTTGAKLEAVKAFINWIESSDGCKAQSAAFSPNGPFGMKTCSPSGNLPQVAKDVISYSDKGEAGVALEFISPLKGPNLESILILVGTGQKTAKEAAALYDGDVKKQALQLGLPGW